MTYLNKQLSNIFLTSIIFLIISCKKDNTPKLNPDIITEQTANDSDDPAIWINSKNPEKSIIFGTDKNSKGAIYAFDLDGKIIQEKSIYNVKRPNNVDISYNFQLNDSTSVDLLAFTEREQQQIRLFSIPNMKAIDNGGFKVFEDEENIQLKLPMGIAFYQSSKNNKTYLIVGRKEGPLDNYLYQYEITFDEKFTLKLVRKFGQFSGKKEIEAIAIDNELGFIYYSDEQHCIRKYHAEPNKENEEIACFGGKQFKSDIEGIAIAKTNSKEGYLIVSDQQRGTFNFFDRQQNNFLGAVNLSTTQTDGCEVTTSSLGNQFPNGLFVAMNDDRNFFFYDLEKIITKLKKK